MNLRILALLGTSLAPFSMLASSISIDFGKPTTFNSPYTSATYTFAPGFNIVANGYTGSVTANSAQTSTSLATKNFGGDEQGLGLANDPSGDNEITSGNFIQLDLSRLQAFGASSFSVKIGSSTAGEGYAFYLSSQAGVAGNQISTGSKELVDNTFNVSQFTTTPYLSVGYKSSTAPNGNILLGPGTITTATPEPGTVFTLGAGLSLVGWRIRKLRAKHVN